MKCIAPIARIADLALVLKKCLLLRLRVFRHVDRLADLYELIDGFKVFMTATTTTRLASRAGEGTTACDDHAGQQQTDATIFDIDHDEALRI